MTAAIHSSGLTKRYGRTSVVTDVNLRVEPGEALGILGPNGAGKSTLIGMLTGIRRPTTGSTTIFGDDPRHPRARAAFSLTPQETSLPDTLHVREVVEFIAAHYPTSLDVEQILEDFELGPLAGKQCGGLSGGQKRRVMLAAALGSRAPLLFLDEPSTGLDPDARLAAWNHIRAYRDAGGTLVTTSHHFDEVEALCERVAILDRGEFIADGPLAAIRGRVSLGRVSLRTGADRAALENRLQGLPATIEKLESPDDPESRTVIVTPQSDEVVTALCPWGLTALEVRSSSLEEAFRSLVGR